MGRTGAVEYSARSVYAPSNSSKLDCTEPSFALALFCSRGPSTSSFLSASNQAVDAMAVQYNALSCIPPLHIVLYYLTPAEFRRYSSLTLCPPFPAWGETNDCADGVCSNSSGKGIRLVNRSRSRNPPISRNRRDLGYPFLWDWQLATDHRTGHWS